MLSSAGTNLSLKFLSGPLSLASSNIMSLQPEAIFLPTATPVGCLNFILKPMMIFSYKHSSAACYWNKGLLLLHLTVCAGKLLEAFPGRMRSGWGFMPTGVWDKPARSTASGSESRTPSESPLERGWYAGALSLASSPQQEMWSHRSLSWGVCFHVYLKLQQLVGVSSLVADIY